MRMSYLFLSLSSAAVVLMSGCAKQAAAPSPEKVNIKAAQETNTPIVIYHVGVSTDEAGNSTPVIYFVNTSTTPVTMATFNVVGHTKDGKSVSLWADDYETVPPGKASQKGTLGGTWKALPVSCVEVRDAGLQVDGSEQRFNHENINWLFQDLSLNHCK